MKPLIIFALALFPLSIVAQQNTDIKCEDEASQADLISMEYDGAEYVDLGLKVKWAICNIGAANPEEIGNYYAWGEKKTKIKYSENSYFDKSHEKYNNGDGKIMLDLEDDVANQKFGGAWRIPTIDDCCELCENCYWVWTTSYKSTGVKGYIVYKATDNADKGQVTNNSNDYKPKGTYTPESTAHIFLPVTGYYNGETSSREDSDGYYWSSSLITTNSNGAREFNFDLRSRHTDYYGLRYNGLCIRPVAD